QAARVHVAQLPERLAEAAELLAQPRVVERALVGRSERDLAARLHALLARGEDRLQRSAGVAEQAHVEALLVSPGRAGEGGEAGAGPLEQRGLGAAHHAPPDGDVLTGR